MSLIIDSVSYSMLDLCRLCLKNDNKFINVFSDINNTTFGNIASIIHTLGGTEVLECDGLPTQICLVCQDKLIYFSQFRENIQHNYKLLISAQKQQTPNSINGVKPEYHALDDKKGDDTYFCEPKDENFQEYDEGIDDDEEYKPEQIEKSRKKKLKKSNNKKRKKSKDKCTLNKLSKPLKVNTKENKSHDKLSAALQKRLENRDKCPLCFEKLKDNETMADHFYTHYDNSNLTPLIVNGKKTKICNLCNKAYKFNSMIPHHRKHLKLYPFKCEIEGCDKAFASTMNLGWHLDNHNGVKKYQCQTCGKTFHLSGSLRNHEETHIVERATCKICHKTYKNSVMLKLHMKRHIYGQRHKCEEPDCDKAFYSAQELRKHIHIHYGPKTFICDVCSKQWYTEKDLIRHKKYHDPVKQHQCSECMKTFVDKSQLRYHEMTHRGERPHVCEHCNTGFITKSKLKRHQVKSCKGTNQRMIIA